MKKNNIIYAVITVLVFIIGVFIWMHAWMGHDMGKMNHTGMDHSMMDPMEMSMADMWAMLEWTSWDELDKAFLEWMIPHHQGAIDMAKFLVDAKHPELKAMWEEIIAAQQAEIDQMNEWLVQWGYKN